MREQAERVKPRLIIFSPVSYPRTIDYQILYEIAQTVDAYLWVDISQSVGLVAAKLVPSPVPLADVVTFGVAPAAMVFTLLSQHSRCSANGSCPLGMILPYTAFLIAAFSALRLAKFNLDTRQSHSFIGLPTPANALFWGSLAVWLSQTSIQVNLTVFRITMFLLIIWSCQMMVSEVPMFALKFKSYGWKGNGIRYSFILLSLAVVITAAALGELILAPAVIVLLYVLASLLTQRNSAA